MTVRSRASDAYARAWSAFTPPAEHSGGLGTPRRLRRSGLHRHPGKRLTRRRE